MRVLVSTRLPAEGFSELEKKFEVVFPEKEIFSKKEVLQLIPEFDAFIPTFQFKVDRDVIDAGAQGKLKIIANYGVGYDNIDVDFATKCGIVVTNTPDPVVEPTAEMAVALMLAVARRISECDRKLRTNDGIKWGVMENLGISLCGKTMGIVGMGRIGKAVARRAVALGMNIIYFNRNPLDKETETKLKVRYATLEQLLSESDVISLHVPLNESTFHLINENTFRLMKPSAILINTARGPVVDETALVKALTNHKLFGAGLDVFEHEPVIPEDLKKLDNVVLSPHNGTGTIDDRNEMSRFASRNILRFFEGDKNISRVN
jgi:D-3-phosphoglycerate dehydrogenase